MGVATKVLMIVAMAVVSLGSVAFAAQGTATFYNPPYVPSKCNGFKNDGTMIAGVSNELWNNGTVCNKSFRVRCIGAANQGARRCRRGSVVVKVVDHCPKGCTGTIVLSREAFAKIANPGAGKIKIEYKRV